MSLRPIRSTHLSACHSVRHGFYSREGGVSDGIYAGLNCGFGSNDSAEAVDANRRFVIADLGAAHDSIVTLYQVHGATALSVSAPVDRFNLPKADAVVSRTPGLGIGVLTADCCPVLFADPVAGVVGAAHAGWRGAVSGVLQACVQEMQRQGADPARIIAAVGPCIGRDAYEVGDDFVAAVKSTDPRSADFLTSANAAGKSHFDLPGFVLARLKSLNLGHIDSVTACTHADESRFFSYRRATQRREPDYGRQISAIVVA